VLSTLAGLAGGNQFIGFCYQLKIAACLFGE
jgi:hypothetical protein